MPAPDKPRGDRLTGWLAAQHLAARFADAWSEWVIAEADLRLRSVAVPRLADDLRQAVLAVVAVVPAGLAIILLHGAAMDVITPANAVELRQTVVRDFLQQPPQAGYRPHPSATAPDQAACRPERAGALRCRTASGTS